MGIEETQLFSNQLVQKLIELLPVHVFWKDAAGVYLGCNNLFAQGIGLDSCVDVVGKTDYDFPVEKELSDLYRQDDFFVMDSRLPKLNIEEKQVLSDGKECFLLTNKVPIFGNNGLVVGVLGVYIDITEKKRYEDALVKSKEKAEAANRAKSEFLANMSHDMKTPLSGIVTTAEVIAHDQDSRERDRQFAAIISASGKQLSEFFTSCLDLSKLEMEEWASNISIFSTRNLIQDIYNLYLPKAMGVGLSLSIVCDPTLPETVEGHRDSLYRALLNLVGNALKFTKQGGVTIRAYSECINEDHATIIFKVIDTGIGIPADKFKVIFEKLQRLTPAYSSNIEGSGIGLYIADQFLKRMGGQISVESEVGKGSTFTISLPMLVAYQEQPTPQSFVPKPRIAPEIPVLAMQHSDRESVSDKNSRRVLLVEDVPIIQIATKSLLNGAGFDVDIASSGQEALALCASNNYGVIYMDMGLPDMQGHEVATLIRQRQQSRGDAVTPIIALTGHGATDVQVFCQQAGMQGVISKPLMREQAEAVWKRYIDQEAVIVPNLTVIEEVPAEPSSFDLAATVAVLGSEQQAQEMIQALADQLEHTYLPKITSLVHSNDRAALRFLVRQLLGCLTYAICPPLQIALSDLHQVVCGEETSLEETYQRVEMEMKKAIKITVSQ